MSILTFNVRIFNYTPFCFAFKLFKGVINKIMIAMHSYVLLRKLHIHSLKNLFQSNNAMNF